MALSVQIYNDLATMKDRLKKAKISLYDEAANLTSFFARHGYKFAGSGVYATTLKRRCTIVKIVNTKENQAYLAYARLCQINKNSNSTLPRIYSINSVGRHSVVAMELLTHNRKIALKAERQFINAIVKRQPNYVKAGEVMGRRAGNIEDAISAIKLIKQRRRLSEWDLHAGNIMFRKEGGRLRGVITDPITR
jgi:hypothetical protein